MRQGRLTFSILTFALASLAAQSHAHASALKCEAVFNRVATEKPVAKIEASERLESLNDLISRFAPLGETPKGAHVKVLVGVIEIGKIPGLTTTDGKPLNLSLGGIGTVMNDTWSAKAPVLAERGIETIAVTPLMNHVSRENLKRIGLVKVRVEDEAWPVQVFEYQMPKGGRILFLENDHFTKRFDAIPKAGANIYEMYDLPDGEEWGLEKQRIWSALSQATAKVYGLVGADAYIPQDGHLAPASYYIHRAGHKALTLAPVLHNERYLETHHLADHLYDRVAGIWNTSRQDLDEYFRHDDSVVMLAPAVRTAERTGVFTGKSVANNTARVLNRDGLPNIDYLPKIELFARLAPEENFLAESNRPNVNASLAKASKEELATEGITDPEVVKTFESDDGYQFGDGKTTDVLTGKARAKRAAQKIFGLDVDPKKPLFVSFARLVEQKGLDFLEPNVLRILEAGGQIVVGGPVGDELGARTQKAFLDLKRSLQERHPELARNFVVIEGPVMGRKKALLLAGHDFFPVPSRFEPCGLTDVESLFMGGQPIAPRLGGLIKGKNTVKYAARDPEHQVEDLGWGIDQALRLYYDYHDLFLRRQDAAAREDFSLDRHLNQVLKVQRVEIYYRIIEELDQLVTAKKVSSARAQDYIRHTILEKHPDDRTYLIESLRRMHADRQSPLVKWLVQLAS